MTALGRPKLPAAKRRDTRIEIRVTGAEKAHFEEAARRANVILSDWIRNRLIVFADYELNHTDQADETSSEAANSPEE